MIAGFPNFFGPHSPFIKKCRVHHGHEAYLPTVQDPPSPHARFLGAHEDTWRSGRHQCPARQGPQAPVPGLIVASRSAAQGHSVKASSALQLQDAPPPKPSLHPMIGSLVQAADFKRLLAVPPALRSVHFVIHHLVEAPSRPSHATKSARTVDLSTGHEPFFPQSVDESQGKPHQGSPDPNLPSWLGCVVPKRHARRAVTRNLIKRQVRAAAQRVEDCLPGGMWLVRLRQPFAVSEFPSAASTPLRQAVRNELDRLFQKAARNAEEVPCAR